MSTNSPARSAPRSAIAVGDLVRTQSILSADEQRAVRVEVHAAELLKVVDRVLRADGMGWMPNAMRQDLQHYADQLRAALRPATAEHIAADATAGRIRQDGA